MLKQVGVQSAHAGSPVWHVVVAGILPSPQLVMKQIQLQVHVVVPGVAPPALLVAVDPPIPTRPPAAAPPIELRPPADVALPPVLTGRAPPVLAARVPPVEALAPPVLRAVPPPAAAAPPRAPLPAAADPPTVTVVACPPVSPEPVSLFVSFELQAQLQRLMRIGKHRVDRVIAIACLPPQRNNSLRALRLTHWGHKFQPA